MECQALKLVKQSLKIPTCMITISRSSGRWRRNFSYETTVRLWECRKKSNVYDECVEAINSSFRKVTKKGAFPNENALYKLLYLRCTELENKWENGTIRSWSQVLNQLIINDKFSSRIEKISKVIIFYLHTFLDKPATFLNLKILHIVIDKPNRCLIIFLWCTLFVTNPK